MILTYISSVKVLVASSCTRLFRGGTCKEHVSLSADIVLYYQLRVQIHVLSKIGNSVKPKEKCFKYTSIPVRGRIKEVGGIENNTGCYKK